MVKEIEIQGLSIRLEAIKEQDYVSITDLAKSANPDQPAQIIQRWMRNGSTLQFLHTWERVHNPKFKLVKMDEFKLESMDNSKTMSVKRFVKETDAVGIISKAGRYGGGTFAHKEIALHFCGWLNPSFQVFLYKALNELVEAEYRRKSLKWHISKITDNVEEIRNLLDTIPGQLPERDRTKHLEEGDD